MPPRLRADVLFLGHASGAAAALFLADAARCASSGAAWRLAPSVLAGYAAGAAAAAAALAGAACGIARGLAPRDAAQAPAVTTGTRLAAFVLLAGGTTLLVFANRASSWFKPLLHARWAIANAVLIGAVVALAWGLRRIVASNRAALAPRPVGRAARLLVWPPLLMLGAIAARPSAAAASVAGPRPDVVLVVLDTLRADRCSAYGAVEGTTPNLDRIAREGALFERALAPSTWTLPSHASLFTGLAARTHGVGVNRLRLAPDARTAAEALAALGYRTAAFTANPLVSPRVGLSRGFEVFVDATRWNLSRPILVEAAERVRHRLVDRIRDGGVDKYGDFLVEGIRGWMTGGGDDRPLFLFVNLLEPHSPHGAPDHGEARATASRPSEAERLARYDEGVRYADELLGRLVASVDAIRPGRERLLVVTSDHGESLGEEGFEGHAGTPLACTARVPLVVRGAAFPAGARVATPVSLTQVFGTLLDAGGAKEPGAVPRLLDRPGLPIAVCEFAAWTGFLRSDHPRSGPGIYAEDAEGWLLRTFPDAGSEPADRSSGSAESIARRREALLRWIESTPVAQGEGGDADPGFIDDLRKLGYLGRDGGRRRP